VLEWSSYSIIDSPLSGQIRHVLQVSADHDITAYIELLRRDGNITLVRRPSSYRLFPLHRFLEERFPFIAVDGRHRGDLDEVPYQW
jgi:hypothetical protein